MFLEDEAAWTMVAYVWVFLSMRIGWRELKMKTNEDERRGERVVG
jgi:hypothetical protein